MRVLLALIIIVPALEISVLIFSGKTLGIPITLLLIILTGVIGAWLAKKQGLETLRRAQQQMNYGQVPSEAIMDGICILIGAILLLTPGYLSDLTGFLLLFPKPRNYIKPILVNWIRRRMDRGNFTVIRRW
ncbi:FxsA family protein [Bacillus timonensis]|uniref:FxsA family protein n=1 Tax=Bacillus timonensis TaxID=1033734 RepID=UPI000288F69F|nr:FxsA family protein [Bacillus timonensis]